MNTQDLTRGSVAIHVRNLAVPSSIGLFFQTMYNVVDSFYAGRISTQALAAMALSFPVFLLVLAASGGLSRASSALIANAIGAKDESKQKQLTVQGLSLGVFISIILSITGLFAQRPLFQALGATGQYLDYATSYMTPIFLGSFFLIVSNLSNSVLLATGDSKTFGKTLVVGFFLNLILDPWFLYGGFGLPAMGIAGIAWATVLIQFFSAAYMFSTLVGRGLINLDCKRYLLPNLSIYRELIIQAIPASFNIMSVALSFLVVTFFLKQYGEATVAAFGVTTRIEQIGLLPTFGLHGAIMALVGQNNGAKKFSRIRETMRVCNIAGLILVLTSSAIIFVFAYPIMRIFTQDSEVIEIGVYYTRVMMLIEWTFVLTSTHLAFLQAIKQPMYGFFETIFRKIIIPLPLIYACVMVFQFKVEAVWYCMVFNNVLMTIVTVVYGQIKLKSIDSDGEKEKPG